MSQRLKIAQPPRSQAFNYAIKRKGRRTVHLDEDRDEDREEDATLKVVPPFLSLHLTLLAL